MSDQAWIWLCTVATIVSTSVIFTLLAIWSAGGAAPWSILPGLVRHHSGGGASAGTLPPIRIDRLRSDRKPRPEGRGGGGRPDPRLPAPVAELEDLGARPL